MSRILNVVRLQLINRQTFIWVPLIILGGALLVSIAIYAMIPVDEPKYGGGSQAPLWYFFGIGIGALSYTFPFSQALSITRRDFFLGTMLTAAAASALLAVIFIVGGAIELATNGWGINGYFFHLPWVWEAGPLGAGFTYFVVALLFFVIGFTATTVFKTWGMTVLTIVWVSLAVLMVGVAFLITRFELWARVWAGVVELGAVGLAGWMLVATVAMIVISFLAFRRAKP